MSRRTNLTNTAFTALITLAPLPPLLSAECMVVPIIAGIIIITAAGTGRAAFRAFKRLKQIPDSVFIDAINADKPNSSSQSQKFLPGGFEDKMTYTEALHILNIPPGASKGEIYERHRKLIMSNHPDKGGSNYFASKINEAKDILIQRAK